MNEKALTKEIDEIRERIYLLQDKLDVLLNKRDAVRKEARNNTLQSW